MTTLMASCSATVTPVPVSCPAWLLAQADPDGRLIPFTAEDRLTRPTKERAASLQLKFEDNCFGSPDQR